MITISQIIEGDIPEAKKLLSYTWKDTYGHIFPPEAIEKITTVWHSPKALIQQANDPETFFAVAKDETGTIVGLTTARKIDNTIHMGRLYVHPSQQGKGIGSQLMDVTITHFPDAKNIQIEVETENKKGSEFYFKKGFKKMSKKEEIVEGATTHSVVMAKELNS